MLLFDLENIHPEKSCSGRMDAGVFRYLNSLVEEFPRLKVTLFVTPDWLFRTQIPTHKLGIPLHKLLVRHWERGRFRLDKYPKWCNWLKDKVPTGNFFIGVHGLYHFQNEWPFSAEFSNLSKEECLMRIDRAEEILHSAGLEFQRVFRPPGWGINRALVEALSERGYVLSGSVDMNSYPTKLTYSKDSGLKNMSLIYPTDVFGIKNITANCDVRTVEFKRIRKILALEGVAVLHGHIESRYELSRISNGLKPSYQNIREVLSELPKKTRFGTFLDVE